MRAELALLSEESQAEVRRLAESEASRYAEWRSGVERLHEELKDQSVHFDAVREIRELRDGADESN